MVQSLWKQVWQFLVNLNIHLFYDPAILSERISPREVKAYVHERTRARMFIMVPNWASPGGSTDSKMEKQAVT